MNNKSNILFLVFALALALGTGCKSDGVDLVSNAENTEAESEDHTTAGHDDTHADIEEPEGTVEPGAFTGSWRVASADGDTPAVYLDLLHPADEPNLSGDFKMGPAVAERLDGQTGAILGGVTMEGGLTVRFNPTTDSEEVYTLQATGSDPMTGTITAKKNTGLRLEVTVAPLPAE